MSVSLDDEQLNQMNEIIAERAYQAIKEITPQMEQDIRNEIRLRYEKELQLARVDQEERIKKECQNEIEQRVELMHKDTIEEYKKKKKRIDMKERELESHKQKLQQHYEQEIQQKLQQNFLIQREQIMNELLNNIDHNSLTNEVSTQIRNDMLKELIIEKEQEIKRKETILRLNYKKKYDNEIQHFEEQIKSNSANAMQQELHNIQLERSIIATQTQEYQNKINNLQIEKKQNQLMTQKSIDKYTNIINELENELNELKKLREGIQFETNTNNNNNNSVQSQTFRRNTSRHTSPSSNNKIIRTNSNKNINNNSITHNNSQTQLINSSSQQNLQSTNPNYNNIPLSNNINNNNNVQGSQRSIKKGQSIQFQSDLEIQQQQQQQQSLNGQQSQQQLQRQQSPPPSSQKSSSSKIISSPTNRLQNQYTSIQSSQHEQSQSIHLKSRDGTQQVQNYLSDQQNTVVDDHPTSQPYHKLDTFNPIETQQQQLFTENDERRRDNIYNDNQIDRQQGNTLLMKSNSESIHDQQMEKEIQERVSHILGDIQQQYDEQLKNEVQNFIMTAERNAQIQKYQIPAQNIQSNEVIEPQQLQQQEVEHQNEPVYQYKPSFNLLRKDSSETENSQDSLNNNNEQEKKQNKPLFNQDTLRNLKEQYETIKRANELQQQQSGFQTFKTEPNNNNNSIRQNTYGNQSHYQDNYYYSQSQNKHNYHNLNNENYYIKDQQGNSKSNQQSSGWQYTSQDNHNRQINESEYNNNKYDQDQQQIRQDTYEDYNNNDNNEEEDSIMNSSSSTVQLQKELIQQNNTERVRAKEIQTEEELINYLLQEKQFPNKKQYQLLWKVRQKDSEDDQKIKNIKLTIDFILDEEKEYESIYDNKVKLFEKELEQNIRKFSEESWTEEDKTQKSQTIQEKFNKLKYFWRLCDTSFKERIQTMSTFTALSCMLNKMERQIEDQVEIMDIVRNNPIITRIGQQLKERQKLKERMINDFCLVNYRKYKEDLKIIQEQINMLNNEYQTADKKGKKTSTSRLARNKTNPKQLFWRNIKLSDIIKIDKWEEQKLQQCLIKLKLLGYK